MANKYTVEVETFSESWKPSGNFQHRKDNNVFRSLKDAEKAIKLFGAKFLKYRIITERCNRKR